MSEISSDLDVEELAHHHAGVLAPVILLRPKPEAGASDIAALHQGERIVAGLGRRRVELERQAAGILRKRQRRRGAPEHGADIMVVERDDVTGGPNGALDGLRLDDFDEAAQVLRARVEDDRVADNLRRGRRGVRQTARRSRSGNNRHLLRRADGLQRAVHEIASPSGIGFNPSACRASFCRIDPF